MDKENLVLIAIVTLFVSLFVGLTYSQITKYYATGKVALKTAAARDIALTIDSIYASPYDTVIEYDYDLSLFVVDISQNRVTLYDAADTEVDDEYIDSGDNLPSQYSFVSVDDDDLKSVLDRPEHITFYKTNGVLKITSLNENI